MNSYYGYGGSDNFYPPPPRGYYNEAPPYFEYAAVPPPPPPMMQQQQRHHQQPQAAAVAAAASAAERHVLAERYKTKPCRNFVATGECPYESRCMFAHGDADTRTAEMNLRDGLITEEAIKAFQRALNLRARESGLVSSPPSPPAEEATPARCACAECNPVMSAPFTHNPYARYQSYGAPADVAEAAEDEIEATSSVGECECEECLANVAMKVDPAAALAP